MDEQIQRLISEASKEQKGITVLNTVEQLKDFYLSNIPNYKEWRAFASIEDWLPVDAAFLQDFRVKLSEAGVDTKVIFKEEGLKHESQILPHRQIKVVPDSYRFKSSLDILEDKILIMNPHQTVLGLVIESKVLVDVFIDMFDMLWDLLPEQKTMNSYGALNWEKLWEQLEQEGNVGLDYVINPVLYAEIIKILASNPKSIVVDFGCGTNVMGIQLLFGYQSSIAALKNLKNLGEGRFNTLLYLGIEGSEELVQQSNKYFEDIGNPKNIATIQAHIGKGLQEFFDENSIDLCVSRNFIMHLSNEDLMSHLAYVRRILKSGNTYVFATLNPDYELAKVGRVMENGEAYSFAHGKTGEYGTFYHYYRTREFFEESMKEHFSIKGIKDCFPITDKYKETHERYYDIKVPMAKVYILEAK